MVLLLFAAMRGVHGTSARLIAFVFLITVTGIVVRAETNAPMAGQPLADGEAGILLLQDGGVLSGKITRAADWYIVTRGGGQMQIAETRVMLVCRTLEEAYEFRRRQISGEKVADHLRLAEWCIRYDLRAEAGRELAEARRLDPDQPRLALLERRLEKGTGRAAVKDSVYLAAVNSRAKPPLDQAWNKQAVGVAPQTTTISATSTTSTSASELPDGAVELFTRRVQPVLVNNCTTSGCHQPGGKQSFQLDRAILRGEGNRRSTMHNLEAALALVDRAHPDQSPLLTLPRKTHGGTGEPIFGPRQEQAFKHLVDWVALVVPPPEAPGAVAEDANPADANAVASTAKVSTIRQGTKTDGESADMSQAPSHRRSAVRAAAAVDESAMTLRTPHRLQVGAQLKTWQPRDAFDPEIFNRAQRARTQPQGGLPATQISTESAATTAETR